MIKVEYTRNIAGSYGKHKKGERGVVSEQIADELCELNLAILVGKQAENKSIQGTPENKVINLPAEPVNKKTQEELDINSFTDKDALEKYARTKGIELDKRRSLENMKQDFINENNN